MIPAITDRTVQARLRERIEDLQFTQFRHGVMNEMAERGWDTKHALWHQRREDFERHYRSNMTPAQAVTAVYGAKEGP